MSQQRQQSNQRLTAERIKRFMYFIDRPDVLHIILSVNERRRPATAAKLFNEAHPNDTITTKQARYIDNRYYWENGRICRLTYDIKARL